MSSVKNSKFADDLINGVKEAIDFEKGKISLRTTEVEIPKAPNPMSSKAVKTVRVESLRMSQAILAQFLNVSPETIRSWEQGKTTPKGPALVMLSLAKKDKEAFMAAVYKAS